MKNKMSVHILNGDALLSRFPESIGGERIVARECLVDGYRSLEDLDTFLDKRAEFIGSYPPCTKDDYIRDSIPEFRKIMNLAKSEDITLWFEEDLFCQVNLWFVVYLLDMAQVSEQVYLLRPCSGCEFNFSGMSDDELQQAFSDRIKLQAQDIKFLAELWRCYALNDLIKLKKTGDLLPSILGFINNAIAAEISRAPDQNGFGKPERMLLNIINKRKENNLDTDFPEVFREFYAISGIYSFGDLQVKRMYDQLI